MNADHKRGTIVAVCKNDKPGLPKIEVESIQLFKNHGVVGDYHSGELVRHRYLAKKDPTKPNLRQVLLIDTNILAMLSQLNIHLRPGMMGENILLEGIDLMSLSLGSQIVVGEALLEITEIRNPCNQLEAIHPGLEAAAKTTGSGPDPRNAGMLARVLRGGWVRPGDEAYVRKSAGLEF
ncbi:MAG: MOSC domain-containing protein [Chloroflexota bacterium]|nr:MAG: MOSC domain-containing protein [Chloroflexota bacterium]